MFVPFVCVWCVRVRAHCLGSFGAVTCRMTCLFPERCVPYCRKMQITIYVWMELLVLCSVIQGSVSKKTKSVQIHGIDKGWYFQPKTGHQICPCSCLERNDESSVGSYWKDKYGEEKGEIECGTDSCLQPSGYQSELGMCSEIVDYPFCPRKVRGWNSTATNLFVQQLFSVLIALNDSFYGSN